MTRTSQHNSAMGLTHGTLRKDVPRSCCIVVQFCPIPSKQQAKRDWCAKPPGTRRRCAVPWRRQAEGKDSRQTGSRAVQAKPIPIAGSNSGWGGEGKRKLAGFCYSAMRALAVKCRSRQHGLSLQKSVANCCFWASSRYGLVKPSKRYLQSR